MFDVKAERGRLGMTQAALAAAVGIAQSNLSAYESGKRRMGAAMERRLRDALTLPSERLRAKRVEVLRFLADAGVANPRVFGSVATGDDTPSSDIDILVDVPPDMGLAFFGLGPGLEEILGVPVDVVSSGGLKAGYRRVLEEAVAL
jgi:predicted nucleotidyltransferase/DNA-binding XRE family transcriptional regulator